MSVKNILVVLTGLRIIDIDVCREAMIAVDRYPNVTSQLTEHLASLQGQYFVEWWNQRDWEERLRRQPQIALRYPELVTLVA